MSFKLFDVLNFDLIHMVKLTFAPSICSFIEKSNQFSPLLAVGEVDQPILRVIRAEQTVALNENTSDQRQNGPSIAKTLKDLHSSPVRLIKFNKLYEVVFSTDQSGVIEVWNPETYDFPTDSNLKFDCLSDTGLFELVEKETYALAMEFSPDC